MTDANILKRNAGFSATFEQKQLNSRRIQVEAGPGYRAGG
jgi:hypothetical protein